MIGRPRHRDPLARTLVASAARVALAVGVSVVLVVTAPACEPESRGAGGAPPSEHEVSEFFVGEVPTRPELLAQWAWGTPKDEVDLPTFKPNAPGKLVRDYGERLYISATYRDDVVVALHARLDVEPDEVVAMATERWGEPRWSVDREVDVAGDDEDERETIELTDHFWYAPESGLRVRITDGIVHFDRYQPLDALVAGDGFPFEGDGILGQPRDAVTQRLGVSTLQTTRQLLPSEFTPVGGLVRTALDFSADSAPVLETFTVKIDVGIDPDAAREEIDRVLASAFGEASSGERYVKQRRQVIVNQRTRDTIELMVANFVDLGDLLPDEIGLFGPFAELEWGMDAAQVQAVDAGLIGGGTERLGLRGVKFSVGIDDERGLETVRVWAGVSQLGDAIGGRWGVPVSASDPDHPSAPERFWFRPDAGLRAHFEPDFSTTNSATLHIERYLPLGDLVRREGAANSVLPQRGDSRQHVVETYGIESNTGLGVAAWSLPLRTDLDSVPPTGVLNYEGDRVVDVQVTVAMSADRWSTLLAELGNGTPLPVSEEPALDDDSAPLERARVGSTTLRWDPGLHRLTIAWR